MSRIGLECFSQVLSIPHTLLFFVHVVNQAIEDGCLSLKDLFLSPFFPLSFLPFSFPPPFFFILYSKLH